MKELLLSLVRWALIGVVVGLITIMMSVWYAAERYHFERQVEIQKHYFPQRMNQWSGEL